MLDSQRPIDRKKVGNANRRLKQEQGYSPIDFSYLGGNQIVHLWFIDPPPNHVNSSQVRTPLDFSYLGGKLVPLCFIDPPPVFLLLGKVSNIACFLCKKKQKHRKAQAQGVLF